MNKNISACIFDLDGVIVDTAKFHFIAWRELAKELGFEFTQKDNEQLKGVSRLRSLDILLEIGKIKIDEKQKNKLAERKNTRYVQLINTLSPEDILPGVSKFIEESKAFGLKTALGSASKNAMKILEKLNLTQIFDVIIDGTKVSKAKPDPEVFISGALELNISPGECIVFEDAQAGIDAAKNAGMFVVGIGKEENLKGANYLIENFEGHTLNEIISNL